MTDPSKKRILIVDDEPDVRELLSACLAYYGFNIETAVDGIDAMDKIEANQPDLIMLGMYMPRKSGYRLIQTLQESQSWSDIPVFAISAHARNQFGYVEIKGVNPFTAGSSPEHTTGKTFTPDSLAKKIGMILGVDIDVDDDEG